MLKLTTLVVDKFHEETALPGIKLPDNIPRSSTSIDEAVEIIQILLEKGNAYWHEGNVYFAPLTFPRFGEVCGRDMSRWPRHKDRFSNDTCNGLRWNLGDFILWHGHPGDDTIFWDTAIGKWRPSWNIQDQAKR